MARRVRQASPRWVPSFHQSSKKWRVVVPRRWSGTDKRHDKYFDSKASAERFIADTLREREEFGKTSGLDRRTSLDRLLERAHRRPFYDAGHRRLLET